MNCCKCKSIYLPVHSHLPHEGRSTAPSSKVLAQSVASGSFLRSGLFRYPTQRGLRPSEVNASGKRHNSIFTCMFLGGGLGRCECVWRKRNLHLYNFEKNAKGCEWGWKKAESTCILFQWGLKKSEWIWENCNLHSHYSSEKHKIMRVDLEKRKNHLYYIS